MLELVLIIGAFFMIMVVVDVIKDRITWWVYDAIIVYAFLIYISVIIGLIFFILKKICDYKSKRVYLF